MVASLDHPVHYQRNGTSTHTQPGIVGARRSMAGLSTSTAKVGNEGVRGAALHTVKTRELSAAVPRLRLNYRARRRRPQRPASWWWRRHTQVTRTFGAVPAPVWKRRAGAPVGYATAIPPLGPPRTGQSLPGAAGRPGGPQRTPRASQLVWPRGRQAVNLPPPPFPPAWSPPGRRSVTPLVRQPPRAQPPCRRG